MYSATSRQTIIAGNWKCNGKKLSIATLIQTLNNAGPIPPNVQVIACPTFLHISTVQQSMRKDIAIGAQNIGSNPAEGAHTGEICANQLVDMDIEWTIIGHSERRTAGESNETCAKKALIALEAGMKIMFAIGETKQERVDGMTMDVLEMQLDPLMTLLKDEKSEYWQNVVLAYEPVWAIGTGLTATPELAQDTHAWIRGHVKEKVSESVASELRIQYGGSMKGTNARELLKMPDIDGGLVGGASLKGDFWNIVNAVTQGRT